MIPSFPSCDYPDRTKVGSCELQKAGTFFPFIRSYPWEVDPRSKTITSRYESRLVDDQATLEEIVWFHCPYSEEMHRENTWSWINKTIKNEPPSNSRRSARQKLLFRKLTFDIGGDEREELGRSSLVWIHSWLKIAKINYWFMLSFVKYRVQYCV